MTSAEKRELVSEAHKAGMRVRDMVDTYKISRSTLYKLLGQEKVEGHMKPYTYRCGRPAAVDGDELEQMRQLILDNPDITLEEIKEEMGLDICLSAIHRIIKGKLGFTYKKRQYTPARESGPA